MPETSGPLDRAALDEMMEMTGGDRDFLVELIDTFVTDGRAILASMEQAAAAGTDGELQRPAHTLKGNAMSFGATRLAELSRQLEADVRAGSVADAPRRVREITDEFAIVERALAAEREAG